MNRWTSQGIFTFELIIVLVAGLSTFAALIAVNDRLNTGDHYQVSLSALQQPTFLQGMKRLPDGSVVPFDAADVQPVLEATRNLLDNTMNGMGESCVSAYLVDVPPDCSRSLLAFPRLASEGNCPIAAGSAAIRDEIMKVRMCAYPSQVVYVMYITLNGGVDTSPITAQASTQTSQTIGGTTQVLIVLP